MKKSSTIERQALIKGKKTLWDACSTRDLKGAIAAYPEMQYIGSSFTYYINGVETQSPNEHHFFIHKPEVKSK